SVLRHPFPAAGGEEPEFRNYRASSPLPLTETVSAEVTVCRMNIVEHWSAEQLDWVVPVAANGLVDKRDAPLGIELVDNIGCSRQEGGQLLFGPGESPLSCDYLANRAKKPYPDDERKIADRDHAANQGDNPVGLAPGVVLAETSQLQRHD